MTVTVYRKRSKTHKVPKVTKHCSRCNSRNIVRLSNELAKISVIKCNVCGFEKLNMCGKK